MLVDRIQKLRKHYGLLPYMTDLEIATSLTATLDELDKVAGLHTRYTDNHPCRCNHHEWDCAGNHSQRRQVGVRVALHEVHLGAQTDNYMFWLGEVDALKRQYSI